MGSQSRSLFLTVGLFVSAWFSFVIPTAEAACCRCHPPNDPATNICLTDTTLDCAQLISGSQNPSLQGYTCVSDALSDTACNVLNANPSAICQKGPVAAQSYKPSNSTAPASTDQTVEKFEGIPFQLNVPIPGLKFSPIYTIKQGDTIVLSIPFFAEYVNAAYRYLLGIVVLAASVMIIYGGFHYILGTTLSSVQRGKKIIQDAIVGLILTFSAYTILTILNPATTTLNALDITYVTQQKLGFAAMSTNSYYSALREEGNTSIPDGLGSDAVAQLATPQNGSPPAYVSNGATMQSGTCTLQMNPAGLPTALSIYQCGIQIAKEVGIPPCYVVTAINHESYLALPNLAGHDENVTAKVGAGGEYIYARKKFLESGISFKGKPISGNMLNDDIIDYSREDLGFDKRFSHGGGVMGMTIPCIAGKCYSQRDRLDPYKGMEGPILGIKEAIKQSKMNATDPAAVRKVWNLYKGVGPAERTKETLDCFTRKNPLEIMLPIQFIACRGDLPLEPSACEAEVARLKSQGYPVMKGACSISCFDSRMPIKGSKGSYSIRNPVN